MTNIGKVLKTFSAKKGQSGLPRPLVEKLNLIENYGIKDDKFAGKDIDKAVMIVGRYSYELASKNGIELVFGSLGENILLDFNPHDYTIGTRLTIGETVIEITEKCTICNHLAKFDNSLPKLLKEYRGLYCKIISSGVITENSPIKIKKELQYNIIAS